MLYQIKITSSVNEVGRKYSPENKKAALKELAENSNLGKELQEELNGFRSY